jgi:acetaldehyde dehydrogenase (acetylating)
MHTSDRAAAIAYGNQMPAARVIINSPTTHGAIGFSTDLAPSMTLGCGSWGGNVTSDNISPLHLMDIKRVAFETKPVVFHKAPVQPGSHTAPERSVSRDQIAAIVDSFLSKKMAEMPELPEPESQPVNQPKTVVHEITPENAVQKPVPITAVEFVSEDDVRRAVDRDLGEEKEVFAQV